MAKGQPSGAVTFNPSQKKYVEIFDPQGKGYCKSGQNLQATVTLQYGSGSQTQALNFTCA